MQRYFASFNNEEIILSPNDVHHITNVMRMKVGDNFEAVSDNKCYLCTITSINPLKVSKELKEDNSELPTSLTLFFALAKGDKMELVIQKATEIGVSRIILFKSTRSVVKFENKDIAKKLERYQKIIKEASEQCHRLIIPEILYVDDINKLKDYKEDINYLAYEKEAGSTLSSFKEDLKNKSVSIVIGSEGGFTLQEVELLNKEGFKNVSLGKRILRCETAAIYALSVLSFKLEQL